MSKILTDEQRRLDKQFKAMEMAKYIREYEEYWLQYETQLRAEMEHTRLPGMHSNASSQDLGTLGICNGNSNGNKSVDGAARTRAGSSSMSPLMQSERYSLIFM